MNKENAHLYLPLVQALADEKNVEVKYGKDDWRELSEYGFGEPPECYRIAEPKKEQPLTMEDITPTTWVRYKAGKKIQKVVIVDEGYVVTGFRVKLSWRNLMDSYEISFGDKFNWVKPVKSSLKDNNNGK